ncbi:cpw-wpc domain-containing protein [Toxoplasma gondii MAS]|uniref:Cpw-wpc domain-containing protein n=1 Tax=Toxoplasma gondii MAS TaxID=943118 RepID=A0A086QEA1_TOXGO|nr:cpw-wpc domain-containing protein [Toxoplasma gondii MAS]
MMKRGCLFLAVTGCVASADAGMIRDVWLSETPPKVKEAKQVQDALTEQQPFLDSFSKRAPALPVDLTEKIETKIQHDVEEKNRQAAADAGACVVDYSAPCPLKWHSRDVEGGGHLCEAPKNYKGFCETNKSFDFYTADAKADWAESCEAVWPCHGDAAAACPSGLRDWSRPCPEGFSHLADQEVCQANLGQYSGPCGSSVSFKDFTEEAKRDWSESCDADWPCFEDCTATFNAVCPYGWLHLGDYACEASPEYKATGPCDSTWNFKHFTPAMKRKFEALCRARFPCQNSCPRDYSVGCPKGWKEIRGGVCEAPTDYTNCGIKTQFFLGMSPADKQVFEKECGVEWPCEPVATCELDWEFPCPAGWELKLPAGSSYDEIIKTQDFKGVGCVAPATTDIGQCNNVETFVSEEEKRKWASQCGQVWPCRETSRTPGLQGVFTLSNGTLMRKGPRIPIPIADKRELGKQGPVHLGRDAAQRATQKNALSYVAETGEVMPRQPTPLFEWVVGKKEREPAPEPALTLASVAVKEREVIHGVHSRIIDRTEQRYWLL